MGAYRPQWEHVLDHNVRQLLCDSTTISGKLQRRLQYSAGLQGRNSHLTNVLNSAVLQLGIQVGSFERESTPFFMQFVLTFVVATLLITFKRPSYFVRWDPKLFDGVVSVMY